MSGTTTYHLLTIPAGSSRIVRRFPREIYSGKVEVGLEVISGKFDVADKYIQVHTDLVGNGIPVNGTYSRLLAEVINASTAASMMSYEPAHVKKVSSHIVALESAEIWLTDTNQDLISPTEEVRMLISITNIC